MPNQAGWSLSPRKRPINGRHRNPRAPCRNFRASSRNSALLGAAQHVENARTLENMLTKHGAIKQEVGSLRAAMEEHNFWLTNARRPHDQPEDDDFASDDEELGPNSSWRPAAALRQTPPPPLLPPRHATAESAISVLGSKVSSRKNLVLETLPSSSCKRRLSPPASHRKSPPSPSPRSKRRRREPTPGLVTKKRVRYQGPAAQLHEWFLRYTHDWILNDSQDGVFEFSFTCPVAFFGVAPAVPQASVLHSVRPPVRPHCKSFPHYGPSLAYVKAKDVVVDVKACKKRQLHRGRQRKARTLGAQKPDRAQAILCDATEEETVDHMAVADEDVTMSPATDLQLEDARDMLSSLTLTEADDVPMAYEENPAAGVEPLKAAAAPVAFTRPSPATITAAKPVIVPDEPKTAEEPKAVVVVEGPKTTTPVVQKPKVVFVVLIVDKPKADAVEETKASIVPDEPLAVTAEPRGDVVAEDLNATPLLRTQNGDAILQSSILTASAMSSTSQPSLQALCRAHSFPELPELEGTRCVARTDLSSPSISPSPADDSVTNRGVMTRNVHHSGFFAVACKAEIRTLMGLLRHLTRYKALHNFPLFSPPGSDSRIAHRADEDDDGWSLLGSRPDTTAGLAEYRNAYHDLELKYSSLLTDNRQLQEQVKVLKEMLPASKRKNLPTSTYEASLSESLSRSAQLYMFRTCFWVPASLFTQSTRPAGVDPGNYGWRWPNGATIGDIIKSDSASAPDPRVSDAANRNALVSQSRRNDARLAELIDDLPRDLREIFDKTWMRSVFADRVQKTKNNCLNNCKAARSAIFSHMADLQDVPWSGSTNDMKDHDHLSFLRGDNQDSRNHYYPFLFPGIEHEKLEVKLFRTACIAKTLRVLLYGATGANEGHKPTNKSLAKKLEIATVTPGMIAMAATVTRFLLSYDTEFNPVGPNTSWSYEGDYETWYRFLTVNWETNNLQATRSYFDQHVFGVVGGETIPMDIGDDVTLDVQYMQPGNLDDFAYDDDDDDFSSHRHARAQRLTHSSSTGSQPQPTSNTGPDLNPSTVSTISSDISSSTAPSQFPHTIPLTPPASSLASVSSPLPSNTTTTPTLVATTPTGAGAALTGVSDAVVSTLHSALLPTSPDPVENDLVPAMASSMSISAAEEAAPQTRNTSRTTRAGASRRSSRAAESEAEAPVQSGRRSTRKRGGVV
ncbi:uncharacterized protein BXZ73DRAFT_79149 [Epithele typhae]|uniref:uncharacterized protein n=1 Tax=Epithele typhae TaxID=378194 RepID=UPI002007EEA1|nr:uncharacterized protein BXZ73DRAFT_79149 [Epithele typhae]KAH9925042.1 hypothetical protein BXZ73DRAFT_79149 [Epithele typhae]